MPNKILIVDDEIKSIQALEWKLSQIEELEMAAIFKFTKSKEAFLFVKENPVDLAFLDINMPGLNGLDLAKQIKKYCPTASIIFATGYDDYHLEALRLSAIDYLQKPFNLSDLRLAIIRFLESRNKLKYNLSSPKEKISVHLMDGISYVNKSDIVYCSSESNYSLLHLISGEKILTSRSLKYHENLLDKDFYRIHNQYVVNLGCIKKYLKGTGGRVILTDGTELPVARRRKEELLILLGG